MKKIFLLLLLLPFVLGGKAQEDSLQTNRYVMRATLYGAGYTNILDTYLSPMEYTGPEIRILRESENDQIAERQRICAKSVSDKPVTDRQ